MIATVLPEKALELLEIEHKEIRELIAELNEEEMTRPDTIEYGLYFGQECSFKDLLAHLICYEAYALEALENWHRGEKHWISDAMANPPEARRVHFKGIEDRSSILLQGVLDEWEQTQQNLKDAIGELSEEQWREAAPYPVNEPTDLGGMLEAILVAPPRPLYRHLPVHIPSGEAYIQQLRR